MDTSLGYKNSSQNSLFQKKQTFYTSRKGKCVSGRSTQSTLVICKTLYHTVESFGVPVPVQVTEALAFCDSSTVCSASISGEGWAWFVIGRRLLIWQAVDTKNSYSFACKELTLPPSDLAYSANLISVSSSHGNHVVSCIVVSPEGLIRYWPNINNEGISVESNANLQGQECETIKRINTIGFILATTTATLMIIETNNVGGRHSVVCRQLARPSGWLSEIGSRFSTILFGGHSIQNVETKLIRVFVSEMITPVASSKTKSFSVFALAGFILQKWCITLGEQEKFMFECNLESLISENFLQTVWNASGDHDINIHLIDMQLMSSPSLSIVILAAAFNNAVSNQLHYALVVVNVEGESAPVKTSSFIVLKNVNFSVFENDLNTKNIYVLVSRHSVYGYNSRYIVSFPIINGYDETDLIDMSESSILGGAVINETPIFFSRIHGFISVNPSDVVSPLDFVNSSSLSLEVSNISEKLSCDDPYLENNVLCKNSKAKACMKAAFLYYVSKKSNHAKTMMNDLFPMNTTPLQVDSALDLVAIDVSLDLINDIPAKDPRWADVRLDEKIVFNNMSSLQIQNQLEEKQQALDWFISFLREMGLWNRLGVVTWNNVVMATSYVFAEQSEKLIAAVVLKKLQNKYPQLLETVIKDVVKKEGIIPSNSLTPYDLFYRKVSIVHKGLIQLCLNCEDFVSRENKIQHVVKTITDTNTILLQILEEISIFRQEKGIIFVPNPAIISSFNAEVLSWTAADGEDGLKKSLVLMSDITFTFGIKCIGILTQKKELINQLISLNSIILEGWKIHVESVAGRKARYELLLRQYENERSALIQPFMELEEYELAATLAEKYLDFTILIQICEQTKNPNRLLHYVDKYEKKEFSQFLFSWYVREKKQEQLLKQFGSNKKLQAALSRFLVNHPSIAWLHAVYCNNYEQAAEILLNLASQETESLKRKKCMLVLSKFALLASSDSDSNLFKKVNAEINLLNYQEDLPEAVLHALGYDSETTRVFLPVELIRLYICEENTGATEFDFVKALDLLHFIEDEGEREDLRYEIWSKSILRDTWPETTAEINDPVECISHFLFFRILQFGLEKGTSVVSMLPPLEKLLQSEELVSLSNDATCRYLLKIGYECYVSRDEAKLSDL